MREQGEKGRKSAVYMGVHEHFEALFNAAIAQRSLRAKVSSLDSPTFAHIVGEKTGVHYGIDAGRLAFIRS